MKKCMPLRAMSFIVLIALITMSLCSCQGKKSEIESLMTEFECSCNNLDIDAMLGCINPKISEKIKLVTGIAGLIADKSYEELTQMLAEVLMGNTIIDAEGFFSSININIEDIKIKNRSAIANATIKYSAGDNDYENEAVFEYVYNSKKWYISKISIK